MKVTLYYNALSPHAQDELRQLLQKQFDENNTQLKHNGTLTDQEVSSLISRNKDLIGTLYEIERYDAQQVSNINKE